MQKKELISLLKSNFEPILANLDFKAKEEYDSYNFKREIAGGCQEFGFALTNYDSWLVHVTSGSIQFKTIDKILFKYLDKYEGSFHRSYGTLINQFHRTTDTRNISIYTSEDFEKLVPIWTQDIKEKVLPFFDQWSNLKKINDEIINKIHDWKTLYRYIPGEAGFKKMIIMKLCNNQKYEQFVTEWEKTLKNEASNSNYDQQYFDLFMELKAELENTPPLYL